MDTQELHFQMKDWRLLEGEPLDSEQDGTVYDVSAYIDNQTFFELLDEEGEPVFGFVFEINMGVPAIHIDIGGKGSIVHIHATQGGLVLTPDDDRVTFETAEPNRVTYGGSRSLLIK